MLHIYLQREGYSFVHRDNVLHVGGSIFFKEISQSFLKVDTLCSYFIT